MRTDFVLELKANLYANFGSVSVRVEIFQRLCKQKPRGKHARQPVFVGWSEFLCQTSLSNKAFYPEFLIILLKKNVISSLIAKKNLTAIILHTRFGPLFVLGHRKNIFGPPYSLWPSNDVPGGRDNKGTFKVINLQTTFNKGRGIHWC